MYCFSDCPPRCRNDKTTSFGNGTAHPAGRNGEGSTVRYSFDMFRFLYEPHSFYLHCTVHLCTPEDGKSCIPVSIFFTCWFRTTRFSIINLTWSVLGMQNHIQKRGGYGWAGSRPAFLWTSQTRVTSQTYDKYVYVVSYNVLIQIPCLVFCLTHLDFI